MGGIFGVVAKTDCTSDVFFGTDYHSHLGTRRGGMAVLTEQGFERAIHNIENTPFRTKFEKDLEEMSGNAGIGCISDTDPQPLLVRAKFGAFALVTVGCINNTDELVEEALSGNGGHFQEMSGGHLNGTELVASIIAKEADLVSGIRKVQQKIRGSMSMLVLSEHGLYAARDFHGRTPLIVGQKEEATCVSFESFAFEKLGYQFAYELDAGEILLLTADGYKQVAPPSGNKKVCAFLWTYYGYPTSDYEGVNVEAMRYECGKLLAQNSKAGEIDFVAGIPDSGVAHAIGYANESGIPFARPFIKYTPTWPRSFMPSNQKMRNQIAHMKLIAIDKLIRDKKLLFIDDSIVRGTQMGETVQFLYDSGAKEVHVCSACPPIMYGCKYLNFSRSTSVMDLITRRIIVELEGGDPSEEVLQEYVRTGSDKYNAMIDRICQELNFTSLQYQTLEQTLASIGIDESQVCTYCWTGKE